MTDPIERLIDSGVHDLGSGFAVRRALPSSAQRMVGPFVFLDHMGPVELAPGIPPAMDVRPHPHIGLSTVTYLYAGSITHRDSLGCHQEIQPGAVNWMVAGRGITHSERFERIRALGGQLHGVQAWVALPTDQEETDPAFLHHEAADLPTWRETGAVGRLIAGELLGLRARVQTHSPLFYVHWEMDPGSTVTIMPQYPERALYVARGAIMVNGHSIRTGQLLVLTPRSDVTMIASIASTVMALGGEPIGERYLYWNFVSSSRSRLDQAKEDWRQGRMRLPIGDDLEFIPLPRR